MSNVVTRPPAQTRLTVLDTIVGVNGPRCSQASGCFLSTLYKAERERQAFCVKTQKRLLSYVILRLNIHLNLGVNSQTLSFFDKKKKLRVF